MLRIAVASADSDDTINYTPRNHSSIVLEQVDVNSNPVITDANFKPLIRHCLKSRDNSACDGMARWDISRVTDCSLLFWEPTNDINQDWILLTRADTFNVDISGWDTSSCTTMKSMFNGALSFDQHVGNWIVHSVTDMSHMFQGARAFNQDIGGWKTDNVLDMQHMFQYASRFQNPDLSRWDTSRVTNMAYMFASASHFNGKLNNWNVARVQHFQNMFHDADVFDSFIGDWNVGGAIDNPETGAYGFVSMFEGARNFNQDISNWDMSHALKLDSMFRYAYSFDQDLSPWNLEACTSLEKMFFKAKSFNQTLCWDLTNKVNESIFEGTQGANADSNTYSCWDAKHYGKGQSNHASTMEPHFTDTRKGHYQPPSLGWRFFQAFLVLAVVALASYWVLLVRRYAREQNGKLSRVDKMSGHQTKERSHQATYDDNEGVEGEGVESDEDSVEIHFESEEEQEMPRMNCFKEQPLVPSACFSEMRSDEYPFEHRVPSISTLLQHQSARHRNQEFDSDDDLDYRPHDTAAGKAQGIIWQVQTPPTSHNLGAVLPSLNLSHRSKDLMQKNKLEYTQSSCHASGSIFV